MNEHVYLYYRFLGWLKEQRGCHLGAFLYREFAREEREFQEAINGN